MSWSESLSSSRKPEYDKYDKILKDGHPLLQSVTRRNGSDVILITHRDGSEFRLGKVLSLLSASPVGSRINPFWLSVEVAALQGLLNFNNRTPFDAAAAPSMEYMTKKCNFYLTMDYRDTRFDPVVAAAEWQEDYLLYDRPGHSVSGYRSMAVVGPMRSSSSAVVAMLGGVATIPTQELEVDFGQRASREGIPNVSPTATSSELEDQEQYPFLTRTIPSNRADCQALYLYLKEIKVRRIAVLHASDAYGRQYLLNLAEIFAKAQFQIEILHSTYDTEDDASVAESLENAVEQVAAMNCTYHFGIPTASTSKLLVTALRKRNLIGVPDKMWFFAPQTFGKADCLGDECLSALALNRSAVVSLYAPQAAIRQQQAMLDKFWEDDDLVEYFLQRHMSGPLFGFKNNSASLFRARVGGPLLASPYSLLSYDAVMAVGIAACQANENFFEGSELYETLRSIKFIGASGAVGFDSSTGTRLNSTVDYAINNLISKRHDDKSSVSIESVPSFRVSVQNQSIHKLKHDLIFADGSTTPPESLPKVEENKNLMGYGERIFIWTLAASVMVFAVACAIWTMVNSSKPKVRASQPIFLFLLTAGSFLMALSVIFIPFQEPMPTKTLDTACMLIVWLVSLGFTTAFAALFSKMWRIHQVYANARKFRRVQIRARDVLWPLVSLLLINVAILTTWQIVNPLKYHRNIIEYDKYERVTASVGQCYGKSTTAQVAFGSVMVGVNVLALLLSNIQSFRARKLPSEYNESFYVGMTNIILLEDVILGVPIVAVVEDRGSDLAIALSLMISVASLAVLIPMFVPKFTRERDESMARTVRNATTDEVARSNGNSNGSFLSAFTSLFSRTVTSTLRNSPEHSSASSSYSKPDKEDVAAGGTGPNPDCDTGGGNRNCADK